MLGKLIKLRLLGMLTRQSARKKRGSIRGTLLLYAFLLLYCGGFFGFTFFQMFKLLAAGVAGTPLHWYYFALAGMMAFALSLFFSIFTAKSELFEAKDNELLLSLPLKPRTILLSRMSVLLLIELLFSLLVLVPAALAWFLTVGMDTKTLLLFVVGGLLLPLLGSAIACLIGWLLAMLTAKVRNQSFITVVLSLGFLAIYFLLVAKAQDYFTLLVTNQEKIAGSIAGWGFLFKWFGDGVSAGGVLPFVGYAAVCLSVFALTVVLISRGFIRVTTQKSGAKHRKSTAKRSYDSASVPTALLRRELKHFVSSPAYMLNCGLGLILSIAAAVFLLFKLDAAAALLPELKTMFRLSGTLLALFAGFVICYISMMSPITAPSISIEGKTLWILRCLPVSARAVLSAKLRLHLLLCTPPTLLLCAAAGLAIKPDALGWAVLFLLPLLMMLLIGSFGLMMNLLLPKFDWINETVAVKQSTAALVTIFAPMLYLGAFIILFATGVLTGSALLFTVLGLTAVLCAATLLWLYRRGAKRFDRL